MIRRRIIGDHYEGSAVCGEGISGWRATLSSDLVAHKLYIFNVIGGRVSRPWLATGMSPEELGGVRLECVARVVEGIWESGMMFIVRFIIWREIIID